MAQGIFLVAEAGFEPHDLRVMSPTSYQAAPPRDIGAGNRVRTGTRLKSHGILSPGRLPIPPLRLIAREPASVALSSIAFFFMFVNTFEQNLKLFAKHR